MNTVEQARKYILPLVGHKVAVRCNQGRNRIEKYSGTVTEAHSNVFVISIIDGYLDRLSCSYTDMVCGTILVKPI